MAGETVLIVDDAPVNLKLTDILLREEGYNVRTATDGEEALKLLRGFRPDLMLVDIQMPGMDGLELTRRLKRNPLTRDIVVVALTACAMKEDEENALAAGCSGFITKPIDTHTLGTRVRQHLNGRSTPQERRPEPRPIAANGERAGLLFSDLELEGLRRRFLEEGMLQSRQMLEGANSSFDAARAARLLRRWIGAAGILGYTALADAARRAEEAVLSERPDGARLHACFTELVFAFSEPREAAPAPVPAFLMHSLAGKAIALVGFDPEEGERLYAALGRAGARPRSFDVADVRESAALKDSSAMLFHAREETRNAWRISAEMKPAVEAPLILVGRREQILALDRTVLERAAEFLLDSWQPEEAIMRLSLALARGVRASAQALPARRACRDREVLIADDDPFVLATMRDALQDSGMKCLVASSGPAALQMIRDYRPQAAVVDVNVPAMDGYEVLSAIREESLPVRVVLLTERRNENDLSRAFSLGADDYLVKPISHVELLARLNRLLEN